MRTMFCLLAGLIVYGCATDSLQTTAAGELSPGTAPLEQALEDEVGGCQVFLPATLLDSFIEAQEEDAQQVACTVWFVDLEEANPEAVIPAMARRPPYGSGPLVRRPLGPRLRSTPPLWRSDVYRQPPSRTTQILQDAQQQYYRKLAEALTRYPNHQGYHEHHAVPIYLGGPQNGVTYRLRAGYHETITQAFRREWKYGTGRKPTPRELHDIMVRVYSEYPIPQLIGITP